MTMSRTLLPSVAVVFALTLVAAVSNGPDSRYGSLDEKPKDTDRN